MSFPDDISAESACDQIACEWIARQNDSLTARERADLKTWLAAKPENAESFARMSALWNGFTTPRRKGQAKRFWQLIEKPRRSRRRRRFAAGVVMVALAAAVLLQFSRPVFTPLGNVSVAVRADRQVLPDQSIIELNAGAEIEVDYTPEVRRVRLLRGEALFTVAADAARPFVVSADHVEVRALGTVFSIRRKSSEVDALVTEGRVAVGTGDAGPASPARAPILLDAGTRVIISPANSPSASNIEVVSAQRMNEVLAWRDRRIEFTDTPLPVVLDLFNRQNPLQLTLGDPALEKRSITGIFWSDDPETFARLIGTALKIRTERQDSSIVLLGASR